HHHASIAKPPRRIARGFLRWLTNENTFFRPKVSIMLRPREYGTLPDGPFFQISQVNLDQLSIDEKVVSVSTREVRSAGRRLQVEQAIHVFPLCGIARTQRSICIHDGAVSNNFVDIQIYPRNAFCCAPVPPRPKVTIVTFHDAAVP